MDPKIKIISTSVKVDFGNTSFAKFLILQSQTSTLHIRKRSLETSMNKYIFLEPRYTKHFQNEVSKSTKNRYESPSLDVEAPFLVLPKVPGSSHGPPGRQSGGT